MVMLVGNSTIIFPTFAAKPVKCDFCLKIHPKTHVSLDGKYKYVLIDEIDPDEKIQYNSSNNACIVEYTGPASTNFTFPNEVDGYTVTQLGEVYCSNSSESSRNTFFNSRPQIYIIPKSIESFASLSVSANRDDDTWHENEIYDYGSNKNYTDSYFPVKNQVKKIIVESGNTAFTVVGDALYSKDMTTLYKYWGNDKSFEIPNTVKIIARYAFAYSPIEYVKLPKNLKFISPDAFFGSELESVNIPKKVTQINERCFKNCKSLKDIKLSEGLQLIKAYAFMNCTGLEVLEMPESVNSADYNAFKNCKIKRYIAHGDYIPEDKIFETCDIYTAYKIPKKVESLSYPPSGIKTTSLKVSWETQGGVNGYRVYIKKSGDKKYTRVTTLKGSRQHYYTIKGLKSGTKYYIKVRAYRTVDGKKQFGEYSNVLTMYTRLKTPTVKVIAKQKSFSVKYSKVSRAHGFQMRYKTSNGKWKYKNYTTAKSTAKTIRNLKSGKKYQVQLRAVRKIGNKKVYSKWTTEKIIKIK